MDIYLKICEAIIEGTTIERDNCVNTYYCWARETTEEEVGDYIIISPMTGNETHAFESYEKMKHAHTNISEKTTRYWVNNKIIDKS